MSLNTIFFLLHIVKMFCYSDMSLTEIDILDQCITDLIINTQESKEIILSTS